MTDGGYGGPDLPKRISSSMLRHIRRVELYLPSLAKLVIKERSAIDDEVTTEALRNHRIAGLLPFTPQPLPTMVQRVSCVHCMHPLTNAAYPGLSGGLAVKRLPGRDWLELVDCWSCHRSEFAPLTTKLTYSHCGDIILPPAGCILAGGMYLIAELENDFSPLRGTGGRCPGCDRHIGEYLWKLGSGPKTFQNSQDGVCDKLDNSQEPATHIKLNKCDLQIESTGLSEPLITSFTFMVMEEFLELIDSQGVASFTIVSAGHGMVKIKFISWAAFARTNPTDTFHPVFIIESVMDSVSVLGQERETEEETFYLNWTDALVQRLIDLLEEAKPIASFLGYPSNYSVVSI